MEGSRPLGWNVQAQKATYTMTTTPTERRLAITKGTWTAQNILGTTRVGMMPKVVSERGGLIVELGGGELDEVEANAELIADAGTTYNTCGLTPSELLAKVREVAGVIARLRHQAELCDFRDSHDHSLMMNAAYLDLITLNLPQ